MKFYKFSRCYEYYALIGVSDKEEFPMEVAIEAYAEEIEGGIEEYKENYTDDDYPEEISEKEAFKEYMYSRIEDCDTLEEKEKSFVKNISRDEKYVLLLIDGSLI